MRFSYNVHEYVLFVRAQNSHYSSETRAKRSVSARLLSLTYRYIYIYI